jgi:hypothetical protein
MKTLYLKKSLETAFWKCRVISRISIPLLLFSMIAPIYPTSAQSVLFDFDNALLHSPLPISQTVNGITAHFSATGLGYSIQEANTLGLTPQGFAGNCIYPSGINLSDLLIRFDQKITDFSILYSSQELACDDAATMRITAFMNGIQTGTNTKTATNPGTWPVDTLKYSFPQGFDSVVIHYDKRPPTCSDYGVIFLVDNMRVTAYNPTTILNQDLFTKVLIIPNPVSQSTNISFSISQTENVNVSIYDIRGQLIKNLFDGPLYSGVHQLTWTLDNDAIEGGVYFLNLTVKNFSRLYKLVVVK